MFRVHMHITAELKAYWLSWLRQKHTQAHTLKQFDFSYPCQLTKSKNNLVST